MHTAFVPEINAPVVILDENESRHCTRVLRMSVGDKMQLIDGRGGIYLAGISHISGKVCTVTIEKESRLGPMFDYKLHIAIAPTKNIDRFEFMVEKCTEMGVTSITPLCCFHSERRNIKKERIENIIISAMKQSGQLYKPAFSDMVDAQVFIQQESTCQKLIAYCNDEQRRELETVLETGSDVQILIGPEGDFSEEEISLAVKNGYQPISLGPSRLRTETAGIMACAAIHTLNRKK